MKYVNIMSSDHLLRSAYASKLAYSRGNINQPHMRNMMTNLHGNSINNIQRIWTVHTSSNKQHIHHDRTCVYGYKSGERSYVVAFKGSSSVSDFCTFFNDKIEDFHFREYKVGVHRGIFHMFESIECELTSLLYPFISSTQPLYITFCGHSLGGSIAMIAAGYYSYLSHKNIKVFCHTFGSPKVGDYRFYDWLMNGTESYMNICNSGDLVPYLPLRHPYNNVHTNNIKCSIIGNSGINFLKNHDLDTYIDNLIESVQIQKNI